MLDHTRCKGGWQKGSQTQREQQEEEGNISTRPNLNYPKYIGETRHTRDSPEKKGSNYM